MSEAKNVGLIVQCASGRSLKVFVDGQFVGLVSISDIERAIRRKNFVAMIIQWQKAEDLESSPVERIGARNI